MNPASLLSQLGQWYARREPREQHLLRLCTLAIAAFAIWLCLYRPLQQWQRVQAAALAQAHSLHMQVQRDTDGLAYLSATARLAHWQQAADSAGLGISHQGLEQGQARLQLAPAPAGQVLQWLDALPAQARPQQLQLERSNGLLQATLHSALPPVP